MIISGIVGTSIELSGSYPSKSIVNPISKRTEMMMAIRYLFMSINYLLKSIGSPYFLDSLVPLVRHQMTRGIIPIL